MIRRFAAAFALFLCSFSGAMAADNWLGAWGYTALPLPPGLTPATPLPNPAPPFSPLAANLPGAALSPPPLAPAYLPILDNPGNVPVLITAPVDLANVTMRQLARVAVAGKRVRLRFSNEGGTDALVLRAVHVALADADSVPVPGSTHAVSFDGQASVAIPAGAPLWSDPIDLPVKALDRLAIDVQVPGQVAHGGHLLWQYVTLEDGEAKRQIPGMRLMHVPALVTEVDVDATTARNVIVTLGDSITEGAASTQNAFRGWPDRLAERLAAARSTWSVVNAGIGGNRLLRYGTGPNALARLDRDVLSVPGVKSIILLEGINDIGRGFTAAEPVTAEALEAADKQVIARAHAHGIKVIGATLTPYEGAAYATAQGEQVRGTLNQWIKTSGAFDGVVDFAAATADPAHPTAFRAGFNLRDHLHPNDEGYQAMANAIDLAVVAGR